MTNKKSPAGEGGAIQERTLREFENDDTGVGAPISLGECPLRSFKIEHGLFCRMVIAPRQSDRIDLDRLHAKRTRAAWRALLALSLKSDREEVVGVARRMARVWTMARILPNPPPPFRFSEQDAIRMALEACAAGVAE